MSCKGCHHNRDGICGVDGEAIENIAQDEECWTYSPEPEPAEPAEPQKKYKTVEEFLDAAIDEGLKEGTKASLKVVKRCHRVKQWIKKPGIGPVILALYERELKKIGWM